MKINASRFKSKLISFYIANLLICTVFSHYIVYASSPSEIGFYRFGVYHLLCIAGFLLSLFVSLAITVPFSGWVSRWLCAMLNSLNSYWEKTPYILYYTSLLSCLGAYFLVIRHINIEVLRSTGLIGLGYLSIWFGTPFVVSANALIIKPFGSKVFNSYRLLFLLAITLIAYLPSFAIGARSVVVTGIISLFMILDLKTLCFVPLTNLFRHGKLKIFIALAIPFALVIFGLLMYETVRRGSSNYVTSFIRVDGISAISVIIEHLPADLEEVLSRGSALFGEILWVPVPRVINPYKPVPFTVQLVQDSFRYLFNGRGWSITGLEGGVSTTVIGEFLWAFGWFGPVIAGFLVGSYINILGSLLVKLRHSILLSACAYLGAFVVMSAESFSVFMNASSMLVALLILSVSLSCLISLGRLKA